MSSPTDRTDSRSKSPGKTPRVSRASRKLSLTFGLQGSALGLTVGDPVEQRHGSPRVFKSKRDRSVEGIGSDIISTWEMSKHFGDIPIQESEIKGLKRKLRPYYEHLALLHDHYEEVDQLLAGEGPLAIATSFDGGAYYGSNEEGHEIVQRHKFHRRATGDEEEAGESTELLGGGGNERAEKRERLAAFALNVNTIINMLLVVAKVFAVLYSSSISLVASLVDSALDLLSTFIILGTSWAIGVKGNEHKYPTGKRRFEPLGVLIFSVAMIASFVQVFIESFNRLRFLSDEPAVELSWVGMGTMLATIAVKSVMWIWCSAIPSSGVQALAQDAENDVMFNIMSLAFPWLGAKLGLPQLDPIGGMVLSTYIIVEWVKTLLVNFAHLSGRTATRDQISRVLYLVMRFTPVIEIADVEVYHIGDEYVVEVDVILPSDCTLPFAHDTGETIQCLLEGLDGVIRAYVHCDYSSNNPSQHTLRQPKAGGVSLNQNGNSSSQIYDTQVFARPTPSGRPSSTDRKSNSSGSATPRPSYMTEGIAKMGVPDVGQTIPEHSLPAGVE